MEKQQHQIPQKSRKPPRNALSFRGYEFDSSQSKAERVAHALFWAREHFPMHPIALNVLCQAINGYKKMPRLGTKEVEDLRGSVLRARKILHETYGCGLCNDIGLGVRATVDSEDQLKTEVRKATRRYISAGISLKNAAQIVDTTEIPKTAENKKWIAWFNENVQPNVRMIASPDFLRKLDAPKDDDAPDKK